MKTTDLIPFIGIGSLGAMGINNLPPDIKKSVFTVFLARTDVKRSVTADFTVDYSYDRAKKILNVDFLAALGVLLNWNTNRIFLVVNLGGDAASDCAIAVASELYEMGKQLIIHVSTPFYFQSQSNKDRAKQAIEKLKTYAVDISIGDNGDILKECSHGTHFIDYLSHRSIIIYNEFRKSFNFIINTANQRDDIVRNNEVERQKPKSPPQYNVPVIPQMKPCRHRELVNDDYSFFRNIMEKSKMYDHDMRAEESAHIFAQNYQVGSDNYWARVKRRVKDIFRFPKPKNKNKRIIKTENADTNRVNSTDTTEI